MLNGTFRVKCQTQMQSREILYLVTLVYGQTLDRYEMDLLYQMVFDIVLLRSEVMVVVLFQRRIIMRPKHFS